MAFHVWKKALGCTTFHPHWKAFFNPKAPLLAQKHDALRLIAPHYTSVAKHEGAVYVVLGGSAQTGTGPLDHPAMVTTAGTPGSLVLDIDGNRLDATFLDGTGAVRDSFTLQKGRLGAATPSSRTAVLNAAPDAPVLAAPLAGATSAQAQSPLFTFAQNQRRPAERRSGTGSLRGGPRHPRRGRADRGAHPTSRAVCDVRGGPSVNGGDPPALPGRHPEFDSSGSGVGNPPS